jgi:uncharacterized phage protein (TIGR02220 family)
MIVEIELPDHPDYQLLKRVVGEYALEALIRIWGHCQSNKRGERWEGRGADYVEVVAKWEGERGTLFRALKDYGWIEVHGPDVVIHNWEEKNKGMLASRHNGAKGGRPKKPEQKQPEKPTGLAQVTKTETAGLGVKSGGSIDAAENLQVKRRLTQTEPEPNLEQTCAVVSCLISSIPEGGAGEVQTDDYALARERIALLNRLTGAKFNPPLAELDWIISRLLETNRDATGIDKMLARQVALWRNDPRMRNHLKPSTLFGDKFHDYYGQREQPVNLAPPGAYHKNGGGQTDRAEVLQTLTATRRQLEKLPPDDDARPALESEIETLEAQLT